ncbi:MAG TPA: NUDIX hydrolase [Dehalococcoidia bacterium]|nr:NUDIX hydrolase [Dehalococcoidia bacterium]
MPDDETPTVTHSERVFRGRMIGLRVDTVETAAGARYTREVVEYGVAVVLVPVDADGRILMVRQYRHPAGRWLLEMPAGGMDDGDASPEEAAERELREETGFRGELTRIGGLYLAPGYSEEYQHMYAATDLVEDPLDADDDEDLRLERVSLDDALRYVGDERICDAKSIAALFMYLRHTGRI